MMPMTLEQIAAACDGRVEGDAAVVVRDVATDTRSMPSGALFVALRGERDGHEYLGDAAARGAAAAIVRNDAAVPGGLAAVRVADPFAALGSLAAAVRERTKARVIAITGSNGKRCTRPRGSKA